MFTNNSEGFTLAEVMVSIGLLGIVSISLASVMKNITSVSKQTKQQNVISTTTKSVQIILSKAETTSVNNKKNCGEIITPGGSLSSSLTPEKFVSNRNLGDGVTLESVGITSETTTNSRIPITVTLNYSKRYNGRTTNVADKVQTSVVNDNGFYRCISFDGKGIQDNANSSSCAIIDSSGNCTFSDFTADFKVSLNEIICNALGATNTAYSGNTICNQIDITRKIQGKNISLTGEVSDKVCVGSQCRTKFNHTACSSPQFLNQMNVNGDKTCAKPIFSYIAP